MNDDRDANANSDGTPPTAGSAENARRNPDEWVTGDQPMTEAQEALLRSLCKETGEPFDSELSKTHASERIEALRKRSGGAQSSRIIMDDQTDG